MGLSIPMDECLAVGLQKHSIHSKIAAASSARDCHVRRSNSSSWSVPNKLSASALS